MSTYEQMARAIAWIDAHADERPSLADVAHACGTSPFHFQRTFKRWTGVSPKQLVSLHALARAKHALSDGESVLEATFAAGLASPGRLHDLFVSIEGMSPGEFARDLEGVSLVVGRCETPFGPATIATSDRGVCHVSFDADVGEVATRFPRATRVRDDRAIEDVARRAFAGASMQLHLVGTRFQVQVWRALLAIPEGATTTYSRIAEAIGRPTAARAVASAIAQNPIGYLVPCHRVLRRSGALAGYRWGEARKRTILAWERARALSSD